MNKWAYALVVAAAALWGIISIFVKGLAAYGFSTVQIVTLRVAVSAVVLAIYIVAKDRQMLKFRLRHSKYFVGTGIFSIAFFNWCYFTAIRETSVAIAAILLYTAPAFVLLLSRVFFGEKLHAVKVAAVAVAFAGCSLVADIQSGLNGAIQLYGLLTGLGAGFGYALYSIFSRYALRHYSAITVTFYTFVFAAAAMLPVSGLWEAGAGLYSWPVLINMLGFSLLSTVLAYLCYTFALSYIEAGRAAVIATLEPIVAALVGIAVFGEVLSGWQTMGIVLVVAAVAVVQLNAASR